MGKIFKYGFIAIGLIVVILLLVPWLFKDDIFKKVKEEANSNLKGELFIEDLSLSLFSDFPNLSLSLHEVRYTGEAPFEGVELFNIERISSELDLMSVIKGEKIEIIEIGIEDAKIHVKILEDGNANYLIVKDEGGSEETSQPEESSPFSLGLKNFYIKNLDLIYDDAEAELLTDIKGADFKLSGDFTNTDVEVKTVTNLKELTIGMGSITYLNKVLLNANIQANYNQETGLLTLRENEVEVNNLKLLFDGWVQSYDEKVTMDLKYEAPNTEFKEILSLVPVVYMEGYESVQTSGRFALKGNVIGDYFYEGDDLPGFELAISVRDGNFKYPELPSSVSAIEMNMNISHEQGGTDKTIVDISKSTMKIAGSPFSMSLLLKNPVTDPYIDLNIATKLDLKRLTEIVPVEGSSFSGLLLADAHVKGRLSQFENEQYSQVEASGFFNAKRIGIRTESIKEEIAIDTAYVAITPKKLDLPILKMKIGQSDFAGSGSLQNMLGYALQNDTIRGSFNLHSAFTNVTELMNMMPEEETATSASDSIVGAAPAIPSNLDLAIAAKVDKVLYDDLELYNLTGKLLVKNSIAYLNGFKMDMMDGTLLMDGNYSTSSAGKGLFDLDMQLKDIDAKTSFSTFNTVQSFAPVANSTQGNFSTKMKFKGELTPELEPDLSSLQANGNLYTLGLLIQPEIMKTVASILNDPKFEKVKFKDADLSFEINDGRIKVNPVKLLAGDLAAEFSGTHGLDQTLDYKLKTKVSIKNIKLPPEIAALNLVGGEIPVTFKIGGTLTKPTVKPDYGDAGSITGVVNQVVENVVKEVKDSVVNVVNKEAEKIMAEARAQADQVMKLAEQQAESLKAEATKQAQVLKDEAKKQADKLIADAKGDPLKEFAAKAAADAALKEADKQIAKLHENANRQAAVILQKAKTESDKILSEAEEKAKISN